MNTDAGTVKGGKEGSVRPYLDPDRDSTRIQTTERAGKGMKTFAGAGWRTWTKRRDEPNIT